MKRNQLIKLSIVSFLIFLYINLFAFEPIIDLSKDNYWVYEYSYYYNNDDVIFKSNSGVVKFIIDTVKFIDNIYQVNLKSTYYLESLILNKTEKWFLDSSHFYIESYRNHDYYYRNDTIYIAGLNNNANWYFNYDYDLDGNYYFNNETVIFFDSSFVTQKSRIKYHIYMWNSDGEKIYKTAKKIGPVSISYKRIGREIYSLTKFNWKLISAQIDGKEYQYPHKPFGVSAIITDSGLEVNWRKSIDTFNCGYRVYSGNKKSNQYLLYESCNPNDTVFSIINDISFDKICVTSLGPEERESNERVVEVENNVEIDNCIFPFSYSLEQNYPNPFNPATTIAYTIPKQFFVNMTVYDLKGNVIQHLVNENKPAGRYTVNFNATEIPSGIYFYRLYVGSKLIDSKKMMVLK